jgi:hypothetical protein
MRRFVVARRTVAIGRIADINGRVALANWAESDPNRSFEAFTRPIGLSHRPGDGNVVSFLHCMNDPQPEGHMASHIERRKFLATLGGAAAWPLAARAQQAAKLPTIGLMGANTFGRTPMGRRFCATVTRTWLDRRSHRGDRVSLGERCQLARQPSSNARLQRAPPSCW